MARAGTWSGWRGSARMGGGYRPRMADVGEPAAAGGALIDLGEHAGDERDEQRAQALLFVLGRTQVGGPDAAVQQPLGAKLAVLRAVDDGGVAVRVQRHRGGHVQRGAQS